MHRPSNQYLDHLKIINDVQTNFKNRIWFTARLLVFNMDDISNEKQFRQTSDMDWTNSLSSFALRKFIGIAFPNDSTWALYEDHKIGVRLAISLKYYYLGFKKVSFCLIHWERFLCGVHSIACKSVLLIPLT